MAFEYVQLGGKSFVSLRQNPFYFLWLLIRRRTLLPSALGKKALAKLIKARFLSKHGMKVLMLPVNGTWCRPVRGGFKVFDIGRKSVIKVYNPGTDKEIMKREIELFSKIGHHEFAPSLKNRNIDEGWYEEEFVEGLSGYGLVPKGSSEIIMARYSSLIEPVLEKMILADSPEPVFALSYLETLENSLRIVRTGASDEAALEPHAFIHETASRCRDLIGGKRSKIYLVFCHGDFHQFNMFQAGGAVKLIDWEAAQRLSLLFDFFNFFFSQMYLQNTSLDCPEELKKGIKQMASRLSAKAPQLAENLVECAELYRLVYYIERIHTFLGSFGLDSLRISRWIEAFREFEGKVGDRRIGLRPS